MRRDAGKTIAAIVLVALAWQATGIATSAQAGNGWDGKRCVSYQRQKDLFYNEYVGPGLSGAVAGMYPAPRPVPPFVGHTYVTYQPLMPHEFLYRHHRSYYTYNPGAGWTRANVRYGTAGNRLQNWWVELHPLRTNNIWAVHNDLYHPGLRF